MYTVSREKRKKTVMMDLIVTHFPSVDTGACLETFFLLQFSRLKKLTEISELYEVMVPIEFKLQNLKKKIMILNNEATTSRLYLWKVYSFKNS